MAEGSEALATVRAPPAVVEDTSSVIGLRMPPLYRVETTPSRRGRAAASILAFSVSLVEMYTKVIRVDASDEVKEPGQGAADESAAVVLR